MDSGDKVGVLHERPVAGVSRLLLPLLTRPVLVANSAVELWLAHIDHEQSAAGVVRVFGDNQFDHTNLAVEDAMFLGQVTKHHHVALANVARLGQVDVAGGEGLQKLGKLTLARYHTLSLASQKGLLFALHFRSQILREFG